MILVTIPPAVSTSGGPKVNSGLPSSVEESRAPQGARPSPLSLPAVAIEAIERFRPRLEAHARYLGESAVDAEDHAQETLIRASFSSLDEDRNVLAYLLRTLTRVVFDARRSRRRSPRYVALDEGLEGLEDGTTHEDLLAAPDVYPSDTEDEPGVSHEARALFSALVAGLTPSLREPMRLAVGGVEYREIAARLGIPLGTVRSRLYRAKAMIRRRLERVSGGAEFGGR